MTDNREKAARASVSEGWTRALRRTAGCADDQTVLLADIVEAHAASHGNAPALMAEHGGLTYAALAERANRCARWGLAQGLEPGDTVALLMRNEPDYVAIWLGLSKIGVVTALLNTELTGASLAHCLALACPKVVIVGTPLLDAYRAAVPSGPVPWCHGVAPCDGARLEDALGAFDGAALDGARRPRVTLRDRALLIYTSGTTGLPKAAQVSHYRIVMWSQWFAGLMDAGPDDRLYDCLPMYHSVGGVVAVGAMLVSGASVVVRERFSASRFWDDVADTQSTIFQYIGELCRYLVKQPERAHERTHRLRLCCGNGLRGDVWETFQTRFAIPQILEFYAATEGSFSLFNLEGQPGAIGRIPGFMAHRSPVALVRFEAETQKPARGEDGFCIRCAPGDAGEAIGRLAETIGVATGLASRFEGYTSRAESEKKILRDVFVAGDAWFRTGDLMRKDAKGFYYFVDRVGDTFRWKGENVATCEVEAALLACSGVVEANVYGVVVPGSDGRAGMAALVVDAAFDRTTFHAQMASRLPTFACPLFVRLRDTMDITGTFKQKKQGLIDDGFDPASISDPLLFHDVGKARYAILDKALHDAIMDGTLRL